MPKGGNTMARYYVTEFLQPSSNHEVHAYGCFRLKLAVQARDLGDHDTCETAVAAARSHYATANGCIYCSPACHAQKARRPAVPLRPSPAGVE